MSAFFQYEVVPNSTESNNKKRVPVQVSTLYVYVCVCVYTWFGPLIGHHWWLHTGRYWSCFVSWRSYGWSTVMLYCNQFFLWLTKLKVVLHPVEFVLTANLGSWYCTSNSCTALHGVFGLFIKQILLTYSQIYFIFVCFLKCTGTTTS
jgi:hypothetical protein